jgi:hypothetical protein
MSGGMKTLIVWTLSLMAIPAQADEEKARQGQLMLSAFECATFAQLAKKGEENKRLFNIGIQAGRNFLEALQNGKISEAEMNSTVPVGVSHYLWGPEPSIDFVIGRIYEGAEFDAHDRVNKNNESKNMVEAEEMQKLGAENGYTNVWARQYLSFS